MAERKGPAPRIDIIPGMTLGYLTIQRRSLKKGKHYGQMWQVKCTCGIVEHVPTAYLTRAQNPKRRCNDFKKHPNPNTNPYPREKGIWQMMNFRCQDPRHIAYKLYGGRPPEQGGPVTVCPEWHKDNPDGWTNFIRDMGPAPSKTHSLERKDNFKGYSPDNCKWATPTEQMNNQRRHQIARMAAEAKAKKAQEQGQ